jgi:hypothetical protein
VGKQKITASNSSGAALARAAKAVLKVGGGRGFVVESGLERIDRGCPPARYVITAAHCLPHFPPCITFSHEYEKTYPKLIGPLAKEPTVTATCYFVDPIADIAVLGVPDYQVYFDESHAYDELTESSGALSIGRLPYDGRRWPHLQKEREVWLLKLNGRWMKTSARPTPQNLVFSDSKCEVVDGMSGSPIVTAHGAAVGVVSTGTGWWTSLLTANLPGWLLRRLAAERR